SVVIFFPPPASLEAQRARSFKELTWLNLFYPFSASLRLCEKKLIFIKHNILAGSQKMYIIKTNN
ncbi:MAG TPA: hypothetical protein PLY21_18055, partial [Spirochaetota bacterium]|nr:hypothetical protein [Spirochaetota bacterium]